VNLAADLNFADEPTSLAFCITDLDPGGAERALVQLVTRLDRDRWKPHVICLSDPGVLIDDLANADVPTICMGAQDWRHVWVIARLTRVLRQLQPALLQTFLFHANIVGRIAGRLAGVKQIVSGIRVAEKRGRIRLWLDRWTNALVEHNVCVSRAVAEFSSHQGGLKFEKISVIPNGVDTDRFQNAVATNLIEFGIPPQNKTVIAVGRLDQQKAPDLLLKAAEHLIPLYQDLHVLFVGNGPLMHEMKQWVSHRNLTDRVHFAGWRADVAGLLKASRCLVLPSRWEGMPNAVLEAMAAGLPVVATDVEGIDELVRPNETGLLIPSESAQELEKALSQLLDNPESSRKMGNAAQFLAKTRFNFEAMVDAYDTLYRLLLEK